MSQNTSSFTTFFSFIKETWLDMRIPSRDRVIVGISLFLIISPFDLLPDFIPVIGVIDDIILLSFILDYFFVRLDDEVILDHFPYDPKRFYNLKNLIEKVNKFSPQSMLHWLWEYKPSQRGTFNDV